MHRENSFQIYLDKFILWFYVIYLTKFVSYNEWVYVKGRCELRKPSCNIDGNGKLMSYEKRVRVGTQLRLFRERNNL